MAIETTQWKMKCSPAFKKKIAAVARHCRRPQSVVMRALVHEAFRIIKSQAKA